MKVSDSSIPVNYFLLALGFESDLGFVGNILRASALGFRIVVGPRACKVSLVASTLPDRECQFSLGLLAAM